MSTSEGQFRFNGLEGQLTKKGGDVLDMCRAAAGKEEDHREDLWMWEYGEIWQSLMAAAERMRSRRLK